MNPLRLSPLPILRAADESASLMGERDGFVDEAVVTAMVFGPTVTTRQAPYPEDLALAADDLDFAGWKLSPPPHPRLLETAPLSESPLRRPAPPVIEEPGLGLPHSGSHRWWLAGLAGVLSTMLFSLLLLNLSSRPANHFEAFFAPLKHRSAQVVPVQEPSPAVAPELTEISTRKP